MSADTISTLTTLLSKPAYAGTASGFMIGVTLQPLEIIKICLIVNPTKVATLNTGNFAQSFMISTRLIYQLEGLKGFWRGLTPALIRIGFGNGVYFYSLDALNKLAPANINKRINDFVTSSAARTVSTIVINPFTVLKTRMELPGKQFGYKNMGDAIMKIYSKEGPKAFFRGISATMFRDVPFAGLYYSMLNVCKETLSSLGANSSSSTMISGMFAGLIATTATHPFDLIRTHAQINHQDIKEFKNASKTGMFRGLYNIHKEEGMQGLFKGLQARLLRKPLSNALTFTFFDIFQKFGNGEKKLL